MRRVLSACAMAALLVGSQGCVVAMGNKGSLKAVRGDRYPVVVNGEIMVVDTTSMTACKVTTVSGACAAPVVEHDDKDHDD